MTKRVLSLLAASTTSLGLMGAGVLGSTVVAHAGTSFQCKNAPVEVLKVECIGPITIEIDVNQVLSDNELNVLNGSLNGNQVLSHDLNDVNILNGVLNGNQADVNIITVDVENALNNLQINLCQIHVDIASVDLSNSSCK